jgi:DeoR/GlpR family transcriptional regulator of sugar metabolism
MYYFEKFKIKIPEHLDGRRKISVEQKQFILRAFAQKKQDISLNSFCSKLGQLLDVSSTTIYRIVNVESYLKYIERCREYARIKRRSLTKEEKRKKKNGDIETRKKRVAIARDILLEENK